MISSTEGAFSNGLVWCQAPLGYGLALIVGNCRFYEPLSRGLTRALNEQRDCSSRNRCARPAIRHSSTRFKRRTGP